MSHPAPSPTPIRARYSASCRLDAVPYPQQYDTRSCIRLEPGGFSARNRIAFYKRLFFHFHRRWPQCSHRPACTHAQCTSGSVRGDIVTHSTRPDDDCLVTTDFFPCILCVEGTAGHMKTAGLPFSLHLDARSAFPTQSFQGTWTVIGIREGRHARSDQSDQSEKHAGYHWP